MINCDYNFCIYNKDSQCILDSVSITANGMCEQCLLPDIDEKTLEMHKERLLEKLEPDLLKWLKENE